MRQLKDWFAGCDCVCFDVDSTVCVDEGIDVLADVCGVGQEVSDWTAKAMGRYLFYSDSLLNSFMNLINVILFVFLGGSVTFQEALGARLDIMKPSLVSIEKCLLERPSVLTPGVKEFVANLLDKNIAVFLVSGGFRQMINPVAEILNIPIENIFANNLIFDELGNYSSFDCTEPTSRSGGKPTVIQNLKDRFGYNRVIIIGDGATDMEASPPADLFIGFGGNVVREKVKAGAEKFVVSFDEMYN